MSSITRRNLLAGMAGAAAALALPTGERPEAEAAPAGGAPERPNILFILSDDHSFPHLGCYGNPDVRTPNLDRLAAQGMRFDRAFTTSPQCVPSRASFMTGRSPVAARITRFTAPLPREEITFPELLREKAGYYTGVCGRTYHLDGPHNEGGVSKRVMDEHKLRTFRERMDFVEQGNPIHVPARMSAFLDKRPADRPFFFWVNFSDPHFAWDATAHQPDPASLTLPPYLPDLPGVRQDLAAYYGEVMRLDAQVQVVLDLLEKRGLSENTLVVFAGDNGYALPHGKGSLYDPGLQVPLLVRWPGVVKPGGNSRALISGEDLAPTLLEAAGVPVPERISGESFLKALRGQPFEGRRHVFAERGPHGNATMGLGMKSNGVDYSRCARSDRYKLIYNCTPWVPYAPVDSTGRPGWQQMLAAEKEGTLAPALSRAYFSTPRPIFELYDLEKDPGELENLAGKPEHAAVQRELIEALQEKMILDFDYLPLPVMR